MHAVWAIQHTKRSSSNCNWGNCILQSSHDEVGWELLQSRSTSHKQFFKCSMTYLSFLEPPSLSDTSRYNLKNADDFTTIQSRAQQYYTSFLPWAILEWHDLPQQAKQMRVQQVTGRRIGSIFQAGILGRYIIQLNAMHKTTCVFDTNKVD